MLHELLIGLCEYTTTQGFLLVSRLWERKAKQFLTDYSEQKAFRDHKIKFTALKTKFSIKDFFSKCKQISSKLRIWSHLLKKSLIEKFIFCAVIDEGTGACEM